MIPTLKRNAGAHWSLSGFGELPQQSDFICNVHHRHRTQSAGGRFDCQGNKQRDSFELGHLGFGDAAAGFGGDVSDAAGAVFHLSARNQGNTTRRSLPKTT